MAGVRRLRPGGWLRLGLPRLPSSDPLSGCPGPCAVGANRQDEIAVRERMIAGELEGIVFKRRDSPYRGGSRAGWFKVKDRGWYEREAWRFER